MYLLTGWLAFAGEKIEHNRSKRKNRKSEANENHLATTGRRHSKQIHWLLFGWLALLLVLNDQSGFRVPCHYDGRCMVVSFRYIWGESVTPARNCDDVAALVRAFAQSFP